MSSWQQRQHLQQAIARQPGDFVAWVMLADLELEAGDIAAGEQAARRALQLRPNHPEALARLGRVAWMAGAHADAAKLLGQASALAPQHRASRCGWAMRWKTPTMPKAQQRPIAARMR